MKLHFSLSNWIYSKIQRFIERTKAIWSILVYLSLFPTLSLPVQGFKIQFYVCLPKCQGIFDEVAAAIAISVDLFHFKVHTFFLYDTIHSYLQSAIIVGPNITPRVKMWWSENKIDSNKVTRFPVNAVNDELQNSFGNLYLAFQQFRP